MQDKSVTLACGQGFYGDSLRPALRALEVGGIDYLCFDALAELTLAILAKDRARDPKMGYTKDLPSMMMELVPLAKKNGTVIITNGGGLNPSCAAEAIVAAAKENGIEGLRVAYVEGDDVLADLGAWQQQGVNIDDYDSGESFADLATAPVFANVYLGADSILDAMQYQPDIVVTGRTTDTAAYLAPAMAALGFAADDWNKVATAITVGHLLECGGQGAGGNFSGDWWNVENLHDIGYPTAKMFADGRVIISKPEGTGGRISRDVLKEQLLYEIHDPSCYIVPDVVVDLSDVQLEDIGENQVALTGVKGKPAPPSLKLIMGLEDGWMSSAQVSFSWPYALEKAQKTAEIIKRRMETENIQTDDLVIEYLGVNSIGGPTAPIPPEDMINEVILRFAMSCKEQTDAVTFRKLFPPLYINTFPFVGGLRGTSHVGSLLRQWSCLVPRELLDGKVNTNVVVS
ncbi:MAG: acyclic terpene utilization AtuA family protein [Spongiibacteraceae bacterium]